MKDFLKKPTNFIRIEFWVAIIIFVFPIFFFIVDGIDGLSAFEKTPYKGYFDQYKVPFNFYTHYFIPQLIHHLVLFLSFLYLNFILIPRIVKKENLAFNICTLVFIFFSAAIIFGIADTYLKGFMYAKLQSQDETDQAIFRHSFIYASQLLVVLAGYTFIKYMAIYIISKTDALEKKYRFIKREGVIAFIIWLMILFLLLITGSHRDLVAAWAIIPFFGILFYLFSLYYLLPRSQGKRAPFIRYVGKSILVLAILFFPILLLAVLMTGDEEAATTLSAFNFLFHLFITAPLTWFLFKKYIKGNDEVIVLKKELNQSTAKLDFLRSQINPHFLFNALNTIYGTAIMEKADRTSVGIEKLSDMMRFMLQENLQDKISLAREIDYLNNYIDLQRLRTDTNPEIRIETVIQDRENVYQIAPMLLIPFVENAFKHGISFREPSHIKVTLEIKNQELYFDVYNSKHVRQMNDPEKDKSGIGLENVKERLKLLYHNRHELIIRETTKEFFVHLTIKLA